MTSNTSQNKSKIPITQIDKVGDKKYSREGDELIPVVCGRCLAIGFEILTLKGKTRKMWIVCNNCGFGYYTKYIEFEMTPDYGRIMEMIGI